MGAKHSGKREYAFFYLACWMLIGIGFSGCAHVGVKWDKLVHGASGKERLAVQTRGYIRNKNFEAALKTIENYPSDMREQALFEKGLVLASSDHSKGAKRLALNNFKTLVNQYPDSIYFNQAVLYTLLLEDCLANEKSRGKLLERNHELAGSKGTLEKRNGSLKRSSREKDQQIEHLQHQVHELKKQLQQLKEIDLGDAGKNTDFLMKP